MTLGIIQLQLDDTVYVILNVLGGCMPTLIGLLLFYKEEGIPKLKEVLKRGIDPRKVKKLWWIPLLLLTPLINATALLLGILAGGSTPNLPYFSQWYLIPVLFIVGYIPISNAFREEFGWRGYAIERLQTRQNALVTSLIIGVAWGLWHLPLFYFPTAVDVYANKPFWLFLTNTITLSIIMTWLYNNNNGSIFTGITAHIVFNLAPSIFQFEKAGLGIYFNMVLLLITAIFIVFYYRYQTFVRGSKEITPA